MKDALMMALALSTFTCADSGFNPSTEVDRAKIEAAVRRCGLAVHDAHWTRIQANEQWSFDFETNDGDMKGPTGKANQDCVDRIASGFISPRNLDVMIAYGASSHGKAD